MRILKLGLAGALTLSLVACGSGIVKPSDGNLTATATTPSGPYTFNCHPTGQGGTSVIIDDEMSFSCPSTDEKANLTILLNTTTSTVDDKTKTNRRISAVLLVYGPPTINYSASDEDAHWSILLNRSLSGTFNLNSTQKVTIKGNFSFDAD